MSMTHRERQLAALRHEPVDRIPLDSQKIEIVDSIADYLGIPSEEVNDRLGIDGVNIGMEYPQQCLPSHDGQLLSEWGVPRYDDWGAHRSYPLANVSTIAEIEKYSWPDPDCFDYEKAERETGEAVERYAVRGPRYSGFFDPVCLLMGQEEALVKMVLEPAVFEAVLDGAFRVIKDSLDRYVVACGNNLDILCIWDDFATQRGMMFSPEIWRNYFKPRYRALFDIGKRAGKFVWFHSCGDITTILPDLIDIGMDVWETVQLHTLPVSPEELKSEYGRHITFFGGINTQRLPFMTRSEVRTEVERCISVLGRGGGYICGPDHHIKPDVPVENAVELFDSAKRFAVE